MLLSSAILTCVSAAAKDGSSKGLKLRPKCCTLAEQATRTDDEVVLRRNHDAGCVCLSVCLCDLIWLCLLVRLTHCLRSCCRRTDTPLDKLKQAAGRLDSRFACLSVCLSL